MSTHLIINRVKSLVKHRLFYLFLGLFSSYSVFFLRSINQQSLFFGPWTFYHLLQAQNFLDALAQGFVTPFHFFFYIAMYFHQEKLFLLIIPPLLGVLSLYLFSLLLPHYTPDFVFRLSLFLFLFSPFYLTFTTTLHPFLFTLPLFLLLIRLAKQGHFFTPFVVLALSSFGILESLLAFGVVFLFFSQNKKSMKSAFFLSLFFIVGYHLLYYFFFDHFAFYFSLTFPHAIPLHLSYAFQVIGIFPLLLALLGSFYLWKENRTYVFLLMGGFFLFLFALASSHVVFLYGMPLFFYLVSYGFYWLSQQRWHFEEMKQLTVFILFLGISFSWLAFLNQVPYFSPQQEQVKAYLLLGEKSNGIVFAPPEEGFYLLYYAHQDPLCTLAACNASLFEQLLTIQDLRQALALMDNYSLQYFVLPRSFIASAFGGEEKGLLFVLSNDYYFSKFYENPLLVMYERNS